MKVVFNQVFPILITDDSFSNDIGGISEDFLLPFNPVIIKAHNTAQSFGQFG